MSEIDNYLSQLDSDDDQIIKPSKDPVSDSNAPKEPNLDSQIEEMLKDSPAHDRGFTGALIDGTKTAARSVSSTYNTYTGDGQAVVDNAKAQELANEDKSQDIKNFQSDWAANTAAGTDEESGLWDSIKGTGKAIADHPRGAALTMVESAPNWAPALATSWVGAKALAPVGGAIGTAILPGPGTAIGTVVGGAIGGLAGLFIGTLPMETGAKAQEYAADGEFTPDEQSAAITEGAKKAGVTTAIDAVTFKLGGFVSKSFRNTSRAGLEAATKKVLLDAGVDISDAAAVTAAKGSQQTARAVADAQQASVRITDSLRRRAAELGILLTMETVGEGLGEYIGELAATGKASIPDAVLESFLSLGQSGVQSMFNLAKARDRSLTDQEWVDAANGIAPEGIAPEQMPVADGIWDEPTPEAKIDMGQMQDGGVTPAPVFNPQDIDRNLSATPSQQMGINPNAGPLSAAAAQSVDSGLFTGGFTPQAGINQSALEREGVTPPPVLNQDQMDRGLGMRPRSTAFDNDYVPSASINPVAIDRQGVTPPAVLDTDKIDSSLAQQQPQDKQQQPVAQQQPARTPEQDAQNIWDSLNSFERNAAVTNVLGMRGVPAKTVATRKWESLGAEQQTKLIDGLAAEYGNRWTDPNQKVTDQTGPVLQNRDRTSQESIDQMREISRKPDYNRLKASGFLSDGAPVVINEKIQVPASQLGVTDTASAGDQQFDVQYAAVEADQFVTSNSIDGTPNTEYATGVTDKARAIAGNGRITGLQSAWAKGNADQYKAGMAADKMHGIDPEVIKAMKNPILVRLLPQDQVTDNIGDLSNRDEKGKLTPVEQAKTDMGRLDLDSLQFTAEGAIGGEAIRQFRMAQPAAERVTEDEARKRLTSAIFQKAYGNDQLTEIQAGGSDDAKSIISALAQAAPAMSRLEGAGEFDIRPVVTQAGIAAVNAARRDIKLADYVQQSEMGINPRVYPVLEMMLNDKGNIRSGKYIGEQLTDMAKLAYDEANAAGTDMFGDKPKRTDEQVIQDAFTGVQGYGQIDDASRRESLGQQAGAEPDAQVAEGPEGGRERPADTGQVAPTEQQAEVTPWGKRRFTLNIDDEYGPPPPHTEAYEAAKSAPSGSVTHGVTIRPSGKQWHNLYLSHGDGSFSSVSIGRDMPDNLTELIEKGFSDYDKKQKKQEQVAKDNDAVSIKETAIAKENNLVLGRELGTIIPNTGKQFKSAKIITDHGDGTFTLRGVQGNKQAQLSGLSASSIVRAMDRHNLNAGAESEAWRSNYLRAAKVARDLGIDPKQHKKLVELVAAIDNFNAKPESVQTEQKAASEFVDQLKTNETYRTLDNEGAVTDGNGIKKGEKFRTASGRLTTPYPKQIAARYSAQWLIDNATQEAESRGDDFNATIFKGTTLLKNGTLVPGDKESMNEYLFGQQPDVPRSILKDIDANATDLNLTQQTEETLAAEAERLEQLQKEEAAQKAKQKAAESKARERDADKARADEVVDDFQLGQPTEDAMSGMGDIFDTKQNEAKPASKSFQPAAELDGDQNADAPIPSGDWRTQVGGNDFRENKDGITVRKHDRTVHIRGATSIAANKKARELASQDIRELHHAASKEDQSDPFSEAAIWLDGDGNMIRKKGTKKPTGALASVLKQSAAKADNSKQAAPKAPTEAIEDFGEKMAGAIKDQPINSLSKNLTDEEMASQPLSALWPANEPLSIEDNYAAAFSYAARQNIPAKPRLKYKVKRWVDAVKSMREIAKAVQDGEITKDNIGALSKTNDTASSVAAKANLLSGLDRKHWSRIGRVDVSDNAYIFDDNRNKVPSPHTVIVVDGRSVLVKGKYDNDSVTAVIKASLEMAEQSDASKRGQFEIRENRNTGEIFINRKGDKEYRKLKTFPKGSVKEARDFVNNNTDELVAEWEAIKERDNVTKADVRSDTNKERTGIDYRNGKDVTSEEFGETFGFRGVEFGNWVSQGKGQKDRQGMLNAAYDALLDLAAVVGIPPKAVSLNGSLGIAFGSRGKGKASAHYETNNIVINLTKTKGAGSLAHEWFHALDNYFSRRRGVTPFDGNNTAYNKANYITYKPEPMMALKSSLNKKGLRPHLITKAEYDRRVERGVNFDADNWTPDTNHPIGVRPTVEKAFADLVNELDKSPMLERAEKIDKGKVDGYWSSIIERAARSFESYVIQRLEDQGISNQYLANVVALENFQRDEGRYPYLTNEELKPVAEKFDTLFSTIETREEKDGNFLMFSRHNNQPNNPTTNASLLKNINDSYPALTNSVVTMLQRGRKGQKGGLVIVDSNNGADIAKAYSEATGLPIAQANRLFSDGESINGFYDTKSGITFLVGPNLDATTAPAVLLHEVTHSQQRSEIDARSMKLINGRAKEKNANLKAFLETVSQRMIDAGEYGNPLESTTYIVEQAIIEGRSQGYTLADSKFFNAIEKTLGATVASIIRDFTKMVRQFALRRGLPINITIDDLVQYAMAGVEQAGQGNVDGGVQFSKNATEDSLEGRRQFQETEKAYGGRAAYNQAKSDGKTKLNYQQWVQVRTPAFKKWFGDSKVVDANGEPLVVYHGSPDFGFNVFDASLSGSRDDGDFGRGFYFSPSKVYASSYESHGTGINQPGDGSKTYAVYLSMKNPLRVSARDGVPGSIPEGHDGVLVYSDKYYELPFGHVKNLTEIVVFDSTQIKSATGNNGDFDGANPDIRYSRTSNPASVGAAPNGMAAWDSPSASKFDDFVYKMQDKHVDTKRVIEAIRDTGKAINDDLDVYLQETLFHGRAAKRTQDFLNKEVNPLIEYMQSAKVEMSDLEEFLHARHAREANALIAKRDPNMPDGGSGMTNAEAAKYLNSLNGVRRKQFENAAKMVDKIIGGTRETIVNYGLESKETVDGWANGFKHYIPLQREDKDGQMGIGQGFSVKGKETKGRTGSTRKVVDILANVMMQRERIIVRGEKNRVAAALLGLAKDNPLPDFWKVDVVPTSRVIDKATGMVRNQSDPMYKSRDNAVVAKVNGQEHAILMNEDDPRAMRMAEALKNIDAAQLEGLLGATATATRYFAAVNTQYNPIFGVTNFVRDIQEAMLHLQSTPLAGQQARLFKNTFTAVGAVMKAERDGRKGNNATGKWGVLWEDFQNTGGQTGFRDQFSSSSDRGEAIKSALTPDGWADTGLGKLFTAGGVLKAPLEAVRKKAAWMFDLLSDYNTAMENGVRLSAYETGINAGMSKEQAAALAKGLTVNFNRKGQVTQQVGALYAFFNASVQGTARLGQSLFDMEPGKPKTMRLSKLGKRIVSGGVLLGASQAVLLAMMGFDDEEPPEFIRERNIIIPTGGKTYISIPMPLGYHVIANLGRIPTEFVLGGGKDGAKYLFNLMDVMADIYNPIGNSGLSMQTIAPTVLDPLAGLAENKDFSGRAIAKESFNRQTPGHALARDTASLTATWLAELVNYATGGTEFTRGELSPTPDQFDYLVGQLTGGVGRETTKLMKSIQATATGDDLPWHNIPLAGRFFGDADSDGAKQSAFYNNMDKVRKHAEEVKGLRASGRSSEAAEYANKYPHARLHLAARAAETQVKGMRDRKRELEQAGATREEIRALEQRMIRRMEQFTELAESRK